jgi:hypothetical protein
MKNAFVGHTPIIFNKKAFQIKVGAKGTGFYTIHDPAEVRINEAGEVSAVSTDGIKHFIRPWWDTFVVSFADGSTEKLSPPTPFPPLRIERPYTMLIPRGIRRIILSTMTGVIDASGPKFFHYGSMLGLSVYEDLAKSFSDFESYTWTNPQEFVRCWRDEPC